MCIVLQLPARVGTQKNDQLYRVAIVGQGYHGLIVSPTTHIPGLRLDRRRCADRAAPSSTGLT